MTYVHFAVTTQQENINQTQHAYENSTKCSQRNKTTIINHIVQQ